MHILSIKTSILSENKHFLQSLIQKCLPNSFIQDPTSLHSSPIKHLQRLLLYLRPFQLNTIQIIRLPQIRNNKFITDLVFLLFIQIDQSTAPYHTHSTWHNQFPHTHSRIYQRQTNTIHHRTLSTPLTLYNSHQYLNLILLIKILHYHPLKTTPHIFSKLSKLPIMLTSSMLKRWKRCNSVLYFQQEITIRWTLIRPTHQT